MNHTKLDPATALAQSFINSAHLIDEQLHRYSEYLRDVRGLATGTCHDRIRITSKRPLCFANRRRHSRSGS